MSIFNEFFKKEKPVFTGLRFGFGSGGGGGAAEAASGPASVSGGTKVESVSDAPGIQWNYFTYPNSSDLTVSGGPVVVDILVVGGGGAGGFESRSGAAGGGGAGAVVFREGVTLAAGTYSVTVGRGGVTGPSNIPDFTALTTADPGTPSAFNMPGAAPHSPFPAGYIALGGGGGGCPGPANGNVQGASGGCGGGGSSQTGTGGSTHYQSPNPQSIPPNSITYGHGGGGFTSSPPPTSGRGGGGGGAGGGTRLSPNVNQGGGGIGYKLNNFFLPTAVPSAFKNALGGNQPAALGGGISDTDQEFLYFGGGGGASDNVPGTDQRFHGAGGWGGGGSAGSNSVPFNENDIPGITENSMFKYYEIHRTGVSKSMPGTWGSDTTAPGLDGRGGGGAGNGMDQPSPQDCPGGAGGDGIVIIRSRINNQTLSATGGDSNYTYNGKKIHKYTTTGSSTFVVNSGSGTVEYFVVAGGGSGGGDTEGDAGGGGAGGVRSGLLAVSPGPYTVTVGAGGAQTSGGGGTDGGNSVFSTITAHGGGGGGGATNPAAGAPGGSGGGGSGESGTVEGYGYNPLTPSGIIGSIPAPHPYTIREGCPGGSGNTTPGQRTGGGGGGAGSPGGNGKANAAGIGGVGTQAPNTFWDPSNPLGTSGPAADNFYFAGGGGGGCFSSGPGAGGAGGGGAGQSSGTGDNGTANTGGGGGGCQTGGAGGSGIVLIAYYPS